MSVMTEQALSWVQVHRTELLEGHIIASDAREISPKEAGKVYADYITSLAFDMNTSVIGYVRLYVWTTRETVEICLAALADSTFKQLWQYPID